MTAGRGGAGRTVAAYSVARLLVLLGVTAVLYLVGLRGGLLVLVALLGSGLVSYVLLAPQRARMSAAIERSSRRRPRGLSARIAAAEATEDAYADALEARNQSDGPPPQPPGRHQQD